MPLLGLRDQIDATGRRRSAARTVPVLLALLSLLAAACAGQPTLPPQAGNEEPPGFFPTQPITQAGEATHDLYVITFVIAVIVFALVEGLLLFITIRYRRRATDTELPNQIHGSNPLEILWTIVPAITVTALFVAALITLSEEAEALSETPDVVVDVIGFQWQWTFEYPDEGLSLTGVGHEGPVMGLPVNERVRVRLHAQDVIHSFYVPQFLYKKDAIPGRVNEFDVIVEQPGVYTGQCAEFCGLAHAEMFFTVQAMERADFDAWVVEQKQAPPQATAPPNAFTIELTAVDIRTFDPTQLSAPADTPIVFQFQNADQTAPHDVSIRTPDGTEVWNGEPDAAAGQNATYVAPPLAAGTYEFFCSIHPATMRGPLTVGSQ